MAKRAPGGLPRPFLNVNGSNVSGLAGNAAAVAIAGVEAPLRSEARSAHLRTECMRRG
jgi:hypothetical protein